MNHAPPPNKGIHLYWFTPKNHEVTLRWQGRVGPPRFHSPLSPFTLSRVARRKARQIGKMGPWLEQRVFECDTVASGAGMGFRSLTLGHSCQRGSINYEEEARGNNCGAVYAGVSCDSRTILYGMLLLVCQEPANEVVSREL